MSASEVTPENYPELFKVKEKLAFTGISCEARPFDQNQGPYLYCNGRKRNFKVWYGRTNAFIIEYHKEGHQRFKELADFDYGLKWLPEIDTNWKWDEDTVKKPILSRSFMRYDPQGFADWGSPTLERKKCFDETTGDIEHDLSVENDGNGYLEICTNCGRITSTDQKEIKRTWGITDDEPE